MYRLKCNFKGGPSHQKLPIIQQKHYLKTRPLQNREKQQNLKQNKSLFAVEKVKKRKPVMTIFLETLYELMDSFFWFENINFKWSIVVMGGTLVPPITGTRVPPITTVHCKYRGVTIYNFQIKLVLNSLMIVFVLANSGDPEEMPHYVTFHHGLANVRI